MNFLIQMPPEIIRDKMIEAWVKGFESTEIGFYEYQELMPKLISEGYSCHGISCFFLHKSTQKFIKNKIMLRRKTPFIEAAIFHPICLN